MTRRCLVSMNVEIFKVINGGDEVDCGLAAMKNSDFCLYHFARNAVDEMEKADGWQFRIKIQEPVPLPDVRG